MLDRLASGDRTPADGAAYALDDVDAARAGPAPARDLLHRPQLRRPHRRARLRAAREAARLPQAAALERPARRPGEDARRRRRRSTTRPSSCSSWAPDNTIAGYAVADDVSARDLQRSEAQWSRAKGFDTSLPVGPVDHDRRRGRRPARPAPSRPTSTASSARTATRRDLIFGPQELVDFITEACTLEPGRDHPHRHAERRRRGVRAAAATCSPATSCACEVEGLGALEHAISD